MTRRTRVAIPLIMLGLLLSVGVASSEQAQPEPSIVFQSKFETMAPSTPFDLVMQVNEWGPGVATTVHTHPTATHILILEGEFANIDIVNGQKTEPVTYRAGEAIVRDAWAIHEASNLGTVRMRNLNPVLQPKDTPPAIPLPMESSWPGAPAGRVVYRASTEVINLTGPVDLYETWAEWPPGSRTPAHFHPGVELGIVTEGQLSVTKAAGTTTVGTGESFVNGVGEIHAIANTTSEKASVLTIHLIANGRPLTFAAE